MKTRLQALPLALALVLASCATPGMREIGAEDYRIYRGDGSGATLEELYAASRSADVTFLGETHNDPVAHYLEESILRETWEPGLALSLEMFETDVQLVLDEYLRGLITEEFFLDDARPWGNYDSDYRPLVEFAKEKDMPVLAANAPRRYVNLVGREGADALEALSEEALRFLPPLPYAEASPEYREKFIRLMTQQMPAGSHAAAEDGGDAGGQETQPDAEPAGEEAEIPEWVALSLEAQSLWDATMAWSLSRYLETHPQARLLHVNGSFHTEVRLGIVEHLERYRPEAEVLVVTIVPSASFPGFVPEEMRGLGDFVIVTPPPEE